MFHGTNLCQVLLHHLWAVVDGEDDICYASFGQSLNLVQDHALVAEFHQWLGEREGLRAAACQWAAQSSTRRAGIGGVMHTRGRRRVPKPPTRIKATDKPVSQPRIDSRHRHNGKHLPFILVGVCGEQIHESHKTWLNECTKTKKVARGETSVKRASAVPVIPSDGTKSFRCRDEAPLRLLPRYGSVSQQRRIRSYR